jgi:hypothetical protein
VPLRAVPTTSGPFDGASQAALPAEASAGIVADPGPGHADALQPTADLWLGLEAHASWLF